MEGGVSDLKSAVPSPPRRKRGVPRNPIKPKSNAGLSKNPEARQRQLDALKRVNEERKTGRPRASWGSRRNPELKPITSYKEMVQAARDHSHEAINFLVGVLRQPGRALRERMLAAQLLLDRAWGRAPTFVKIAGDDKADAPQRAEQSEESRQTFAKEVLQILIDCGAIKLPAGAVVLSQQTEEAHVVEPEVVESEVISATRAPSLDELLRGVGVEPVESPPRPTPFGHLEDDAIEALRRIIEHPEWLSTDPAQYRNLRRDLLRHAMRFPAEREAAERAVAVLDKRLGAP
jgi:hypothetical protein